VQVQLTKVRGGELAKRVFVSDHQRPRTEGLAMAEHTTAALDVALAYHRSWTSRDFDRAMTYIAEDIVCGGMAALLGGRRSGQGRGLCGR
jgi:hypothetical protein